MNEGQDTNQRTYRDILPDSTSIIDFAYSEKHPLRVGAFSISHKQEIDYHGLEFDNTYGRESESDDEDYSYSSDEINCKAVALFDFMPENDNEVALTEGQIIWISYRHGQGWLVAEDSETGENGLVPEEYVEIYYDDEVEDMPKRNEIDDIPKPFLPEILQNYNIQKREDSDSEWVDTDDDIDAEDARKIPADNIKEKGAHGEHIHNEQRQTLKHPGTDSNVGQLQEEVHELSLS